MTMTQTSAVKAVFKEAALTPTDEIRLNRFVFSRDTRKTSKQTEASMALGGISYQGTTNNQQVAEADPKRLFSLSSGMGGVCKGKTIGSQGQEQTQQGLPRDPEKPGEVIYRRGN